MIIRNAQVEDAHDLAYVHVSSWQTTYRGIMPDEIFDKLTVENRAKFWARVIEEDRENEALLLAEDATKILGFVSGGKAREDAVEGYDGELYAIYLLQSVQGKGIGRKLIEAFAEQMHQKGYQSMILWVLADNPESRGFYEHMGGKVVAEGTYEIAGATLKTVAYGWPDILSLVPNKE